MARAEAGAVLTRDARREAVRRARVAEERAAASTVVRRRAGSSAMAVAVSFWAAWAASRSAAFSASSMDSLAVDASLSAACVFGSAQQG